MIQIKHQLTVYIPYIIRCHLIKAILNINTLYSQYRKVDIICPCKAENNYSGLSDLTGVSQSSQMTYSLTPSE